MALREIFLFGYSIVANFFSCQASEDHQRQIARLSLVIKWTF